MLFIILSIAVVLVTMSITMNTTNDNTLREFCKLECKRDITKSHKFCC